MLSEKKDMESMAVSYSLPQSKVWTSLGNSKEALVRISSEEIGNESNEVIISEKEINEGDLVYYKDGWYTVVTLKENIVSLKVEEQIKEVSLDECTKNIYLQILLCTFNSVLCHVLAINGTMSLEKLAKKLRKRFSLKPGKSEWYYDGNNCSITDTIKSLKIKPYDKIFCITIELEIRTFKRFKELDNDSEWHMSSSSPDAITFIPNKVINLYGFGMYYARTGSSTYKIEYKVFLNSNEEKKEIVTIIRREDESRLQRIYLNADKMPIEVSSGTTITIVVYYTDYDPNSQLYSGLRGSEYELIEGNESGLFKVN